MNKLHCSLFNQALAIYSRCGEIRSVLRRHYVSKIIVIIMFDGVKNSKGSYKEVTLCNSFMTEAVII